MFTFNYQQVIGQMYYYPYVVFGKSSRLGVYLYLISCITKVFVSSNFWGVTKCFYDIKTLLHTNYMKSNEIPTNLIGFHNSMFMGFQWNPDISNTENPSTKHVIEMEFNSKFVEIHSNTAKQTRVDSFCWVLGWLY